MSRIQEVFDDCFQRLLMGESLESCLSRYPEYAAELDPMLRTAFDVKRKAFPVQPRPEFKYWARVRLQNAMYYPAPKEEPEKISFSNLRRNLAVSLAALLALIIASSGTVAASSQAMPDNPLYTVKIAVEQTQIALTPTDIGKAELLAQFSEKRAQEIAAMADKGNTDQVIATTARLNDQLDQADALVAKYEAALTQSGIVPGAKPTYTTPTVVSPTLPRTAPAPATTSPTVGIPIPTPTPAGTTTTTPPTPQPVENVTTAPQPTLTVQAPSENATAENTTAASTALLPAAENATAENATAITAVTQPTLTSENATAENVTAENATLTSAPAVPAALNAPAVTANVTTTRATATLSQSLNTAVTDINASTDKSLTILQNALDKAPASTRSSLANAIERTKKARLHITALQSQSATPSANQNTGQTTGSSASTTDNSTGQQNTTTNQQNTGTTQQGTSDHNYRGHGR